ncbi:MAG: outer membrane lipoprotein carrier protein LolA [Chitinophagaceae bacterium]|nr:outer membrane lipoprotein carrier protein LolA [Chitinophagaceae bacterium]
MKKVYLSLLVILFASASQAQNNSLGNSDPEAKKILDAVSAKFKTYKGVQAVFTLIAEDSKGKVQGNKKGTVFMKGNRYKVIITGQEIFCDGTTIWTYDKAANEVTITSVDPSANSITPQKLFTNFYDKDFLYKLNGEKTQAGKKVQEIELTPTDKSRNFHKVYLTVDKASQSIVSTKILEKGGNKFSYIVNTFNGKANLTDASFVFDKAKYPGVDVVDLR